MSKINPVITADAKTSLRKLPFPVCALDVLTKIEQLCISQNAHRTQSSQNIKQMELAMEMISEFIFRELGAKSFKKKLSTHQGLTKIQELQLLEMLCTYMSQCDDASSHVVKNAVYMFLFPHSHAHRSKLIVKLVSMAISTSNYQVLISTGILIQQVGCTTKFSMDIAEGLVSDYFVLLPHSLSKLEDLPVHAPLFTANLLTALSEMYNKSNINENLLEVISEWIFKHPSLCYTPLITDLLSSLPNGAIPMPALTPFLGLFKWCILAPFYSQSNLFSKLHLALLTSLLEVKTYVTSSTQRNIISAEGLCTIVSYLQILITENDAKATSSVFVANPSSAETKPSVHETEHIHEEAIHRLAQCIQVAVFTQTMYGNKTKLLAQLSMLPQNRLLTCVLDNVR